MCAAWEAAVQIGLLGYSDKPDPSRLVGFTDPGKPCRAVLCAVCDPERVRWGEQGGTPERHSALLPWHTRVSSCPSQGTMTTKDLLIHTPAHNLVMASPRGLFCLNYMCVHTAMQDEVDEQDHDFKGPKYVYPKPGSGYHGSSEHHGGDSYHHRRHGSHSYDAPHHHHSYSSRQGGHGQQHYTGDSSYYHGHEEYRQQYRDSYGQYSEEQYNEERYGDDDEEQYYSGSGYDEPKRTTYSYHGSYEDVCVRETARSQCDETAAHGYIYT